MGHPWGIALRLLVGTRFQALFHSASHRSFHLSLTVLVRYRSPGVFSLRGWSPQIRPGFHEARATWDRHPERPLTFRLRGSHPLRRAIPDHFG